VESKDIKKFVRAGANTVIGGLAGVVGAVRYLKLAKEYGKDEAVYQLKKLFKRRD
jgi:hypothetical protein